MLEEISELEKRASSGDPGAAAGLAPRRAQLEALDAERESVEARAEIEKTLPSSCRCLGVGGYGRLIVVTGGIPLFSDYCVCARGRALRVKAERLNRLSEGSDQEAEDREREQARQDRAERLLERAGIDPLYRAATVRGYLKRLKEEMDVPEELDEYLKVLGYRYYEDAPTRGDFLYGPAGHGKTWITAALVQAWIRRSRPAMFIRHGAFLDTLKAGLSARDGSGDALLKRMEGIELLAIDDFCMYPMTAFERARTTNLLMVRHAGQPGKLTIINSNYSPDEVALRLAGDDQSPEEVRRIVGRIHEMCDVMKLQTVDLRSASREVATRLREELTSAH